MLQPAELSPDLSETPEELTERVVHAAEELADTLDVVPDGQARQELVRAMDRALEHTGVQVVDLRSHTGEIFGLDPDALGDQKGVKTGRTRAEVLAARALNQIMRRAKRRR
jgi:hypothetical protein